MPETAPIKEKTSIESAQNISANNLGASHDLDQSTTNTGNASIESVEADNTTIDSKNYDVIASGMDTNSDVNHHVIGTLDEETTDNSNQFVSGVGQSERSVFYPIQPIGVSYFQEYNYAGIEIPNPEKSEEEETEELVKKEEDDKGFPRLSAAILYSPDLSSVGLGDFSEAGTRFGGMLSYAFNNRVEFRAGFIRIRNYYSADGSQYKPSGYGGGYGGYNSFSATSAVGRCDIVEIPVNLKVNFLNKRKHHLFVSGGLSSYIMLNEYYEFEYGDNPPQNAIGSWQSKETSSHILGIFNASTGYEYEMAPRWSFQVEPFINIPITGIGWGEVDLYSIGSYFTLKYVIYRKK